MCWPFFNATDEVIVEERRPHSWNEPRRKRLRYVRNPNRNSGNSEEWALTTRSMSRRLNQQEMWDLRKWEAQQRFNDAEFQRRAIQNRVDDRRIEQEDQQRFIQPARPRHHQAIQISPEVYNMEQVMQRPPQWSDQAFGSVEIPHQREFEREENHYFGQNDDIQRVEDPDQDQDRNDRVYGENSRPLQGRERDQNGTRGVNFVQIEPEGVGTRRDIQHDGVQSCNRGDPRRHTSEYSVHDLHQNHDPAFVETHRGHSRSRSRSRGGDEWSMYLDGHGRPARTHSRPQRW